jgi:hypothetical protein
MRTLIVGLLASGVSITMMAGSAMAADTKAPVKPAAFKPVTLSDGHPSLEGNWTNATITPLERPTQFKNEKFLTKAEWDKLNGASQALIDKGNAPTPVNATTAEVSANADCSGGRGTNCNYNAAWTDPGSNVMTVAGQPLSSFITSTLDGRMPARVAGAPVVARFQANEGEEGGEAAPARPARPAATGAAVARPSQNDNPEGRSLGERCLTSFGNSAGPVMLPLLYNNTYQIVQTKDYIAIDVEMVHDVRIIHMSNQHRTDGVKPWYGDSIGHWEGNTLVVETTDYNPKQNFRGSDQNLKVTERFTRTGNKALHYEFTVADPTVWTQPWSGEYEFKPASGMVYEYACHEGNYGLMNILAGARAGEEDAAKAAASKPRAEAAPAAVATTR